MPTFGKKKLTLTVDNEVVEKAKKLGLNLSEITENVLRGFAFSATEGGEALIHEKYKELFQVMRPLLQKYNVPFVQVGNEPYDDDETGDTYIATGFYLDREGKITDAADNEYDLKEIAVGNLDAPKEILANFINELSKARQRLDDKVEELEMAKRIILAMNERLAPTSQTSKRAD